MIIKVSAPNVYEQYGRAERSGGVLTSRATKLKLTSNLPGHVWPEIYEAARYLLNRSPKRRLGWKSPIVKLQEWLELTDPLLNCYYLKPYSCRAYEFIHKRPKLPKLAAKVHVRYIVRYLSANIWKIWIPELKRVVAIRDVTFDSTKRYSLKDE